MGRKRIYPELEEKECVECGDVFLPKTHTQRYCDRKCAMEAGRHHRLGKYDQVRLEDGFTTMHDEDSYP